MATKTDCRNAIINAYGSLERNELMDAESFIDDAHKGLKCGLEAGGFDEEETPTLTRVKFRDWWTVRHLNPVRWFNRTDCPSEPHTIVEPKRRVTVKKLIAIMAVSAVVGVSSNYLSGDFGGPADVSRGQFTQVQVCDGCKVLRNGGDLCPNCGATESAEKIAAPLNWQLFGVGPVHQQGWQFKDGSTNFFSDGQYVVPELIVSKTKRM